MSFFKRLLHNILSWFRFKPPENLTDDFDIDIKQEKENVSENQTVPEQQTFEIIECDVVEIRELDS